MSTANVIPEFTLSILGVKVLEALISVVVSGPIYTALNTQIDKIKIQKNLLEAILSAESEFVRNFKDKAVCDALLQLPIANLPSFQKGVFDFFYKYSEDQLTFLLTQQLIAISPKFSSRQISSAVSSYLYFLQQKLIIVSEEFRKLSVPENTLDINRNTSEIADDVHEIKEIMLTQSRIQIHLGLLPPKPGLFVGRENDLAAIKRRIGIGGEFRPTTIIRGWPGVGKTTLIAQLAHDKDVARAFPDGVLWAGLGQTPQLLGELFSWGRALHFSEIRLAEDIEEATNQLAAVLRGRHMLLLVDDVWEAAHGKVFQFGGEYCATLFSTRVTIVAEILATEPDDVYRLDKLTNEHSLELFKKLAPGVVRDYHDYCIDLVEDLEGLPLSIQIAGRLLESEYDLGFPIKDRIKEIRSGKILFSSVPVDRITEDGVTPTLVSLLKMSINALDSFTRDCFACLADFAPKPARFHLRTLAHVWELNDPTNIIKTLCGRGLLEPVGDGYYQMHSILVWYAKELNQHHSL